MRSKESSLSVSTPGNSPNLGGQGWGQPGSESFWTLLPLPEMETQGCSHLETLITCVPTCKQTGALPLVTEALPRLALGSTSTPL